MYRYIHIDRQIQGNIDGDMFLYAYVDRYIARWMYVEIDRQSDR